MPDLLGNLAGYHGYVVLAVLLFIESVGVPIPGETVLVTAAALAGRGAMSLTGVVITGAASTIAGGLAAYWLGLRGGPAVISRYGRVLHIDGARLERAHGFFRAHGAKTVVLGRFVAFVRSFLGLFAGISRMPLARFAMYNAVGGVLWTAVFSGLGFAFGRNLPRLVRYLGRVSLLLAVLVALGVGLVFLNRWFARNRAVIVARIDDAWAGFSAAPRLQRLRAEHPRLWNTVAGRFAQGEYLMLHLGIGLLASFAVIGFFGAITEDIVEGSPLTRFDSVVAQRLHAAVTPSALHVFRFLSATGSATAMTTLLIVGAVVLLVRRKPLDFIAWVSAFVGGAMLDVALRAVVRRSQLPFADVVVADWRTGLASGHALGALIGFGMLAYLIVGSTRHRVAQAAAVVAALAVVSAIAVSRLFLGVQFVSDASAGIAAGMLWLTACVSGLEIAKQQSAGRLVG
ncbi:MAG TPA: VTT domain-containing protein [Gemmatimonadaceae bacterium]